MIEYQAVVFDLDGTLLDTIDDLADAANRSLEKLGFPVHPTSAYKIFVGDGMRALVERILPEDKRDDATVDRAYEMMREEYSQSWDAKSKPYEGICEMLRSLESKGMKLAVLSNKPDFFTKLCVKKFFPDTNFQQVLGVCEIRPPKPDPTGALNLAKELGVEPRNCLYMGDTNTDMQTANSAGMFAIGVEWGFRTREELAKNNARKIISRPAEVLELLN